MLLHQLNARKQKYPKARVGRGGKRGTTSGHGTKGQKSRAGRRIRPGWRDMLQRTPKLRGIGNKPVSPQFPVRNVGDLAGFPAGAVLDRKTFGGPVKILGEGTIAHAITVKGLPISKSAKAKILAAGGKVINE